MWREGGSVWREGVHIKGHGRAWVMFTGVVGVMVSVVAGVVVVVAERLCRVVNVKLILQ